MSIYQVSNSAIPSIVGYSALALGVLSAGSLLVGGRPVINVPGVEVVDFAASALTALAGGAILKSRDPVAGWMGAALVATWVAYAGLSIDTDQAGNMLSAAKNAATAGVSAGVGAATTAATTAATPWQPLRELTPKESAECDANLPWTTTEAGLRNCSRASDGKRYVWRAG